MKRGLIEIAVWAGLTVAAHAAVPEKIPAVVVTDTDWNILQKVGGFTASNGLDLLPARLRGDKLRFFRVTTLTPPRRDNPSKKGIGASLAFFEYKDGSFIDITEPDRSAGRVPEARSSPKGK